MSLDTRGWVFRLLVVHWVLQDLVSPEKTLLSNTGKPAAWLPGVTNKLFCTWNMPLAIQVPMMPSVHGLIIQGATVTTEP